MRTILIDKADMKLLESILTQYIEFQCNRLGDLAVQQDIVIAAALLEDIRKRWSE